MLLPSPLGRVQAHPGQAEPFFLPGRPKYPPQLPFSQAWTIFESAPKALQRAWGRARPLVHSAIHYSFLRGGQGEGRHTLPHLKIGLCLAHPHPQLLPEDALASPWSPKPSTQDNRAGGCGLHLQFPFPPPQGSVLESGGTSAQPQNQGPPPNWAYPCPRPSGMTSWLGESPAPHLLGLLSPGFSPVEMSGRAADPV